MKLLQSERASWNLSLKRSFCTESMNATVELSGIAPSIGMTEIKRRHKRTGLNFIPVKSKMATAISIIKY
jgi:hypothetical protein